MTTQDRSTTAAKKAASTRGSNRSDNTDLDRRLASILEDNQRALVARDARLDGHDVTLDEHGATLGEYHSALETLTQLTEINTNRLNGHDDDVNVVTRDVRALGARVNGHDDALAELVRVGTQNANTVGALADTVRTVETRVGTIDTRLTAVERKHRLSAAHLGIAAGVAVFTGLIGYLIGQWMVGGHANVSGQPATVVNAVMSEWYSKLHKGHTYGFWSFAVFGFFAALSVLYFVPSRQQEDESSDVSGDAPAPPRQSWWRRNVTNRNAQGAPANAESASGQSSPAPAPVPDPGAQPTQVMTQHP